MVFMAYVGKFFTIFTALTTYALMGNPLSPAVVFPYLMLYMVVNRMLLQLLPAIIRVWADMKVTRKRFQVNVLFHSKNFRF